MSQLSVFNNIPHQGLVIYENGVPSIVCTPTGQMYSVNGTALTQRPINVTRLFRDVFTDCFFVELTWHQLGGGIQNEIIRKGDVTNQVELRNLTNRGAPIDTDNREQVNLLKMLANRLDMPEDAATRLGWHNFSLVVPGGPYEFLNFDTRNWMPSSVADAKSARAALRDVLSWGVTPALVMVGASLASPVVARLRLERNPIFSFTKTSNSGKTTLQKYALSFWANPSSTDTLYLAKASPAGFINFALQRQSMPLAIDDTQNMRAEQVAELIYGAAAGTDAVRSNKEGGLNLKSTSWNGVFLSASELSMLSGTTGTGAVNRTIELTDEPLGSCSEQELKRRVSVLRREANVNYAVLRNDIVSQLEADSVEDEVYHLRTYAEQNDAPRGLAEAIAVAAFGVCIAGRLASNPSTVLPFHVIDYLIEGAHETRATGKSLAENAFDELMNRLSALQVNGEQLIWGQETVCRVCKDNAGVLHRHVNFSTSALAQWRNQYGEAKRFYSEWAQRGWLKVTYVSGKPQYIHQVRLSPGQNPRKYPAFPV